MKNDKINFSLIDKGLSVDGTISSKGKLIIKGTIKGTLVGETVIIADEGVVCADTKVVSITIGGKFEGDINASNEMIILSTGNCTGSVVCKNLVVEAGGILNADVTCLTSEESIPEKKLVVL